MPSSEPIGNPKLTQLDTTETAPVGDSGSDEVRALGAAGERVFGAGSANLDRGDGCRPTRRQGLAAWPRTLDRDGVRPNGLQGAAQTAVGQDRGGPAATQEIYQGLSARDARADALVTAWRDVQDRSFRRLCCDTGLSEAAIRKAYDSGHPDKLRDAHDAMRLIAGLNLAIAREFGRVAGRLHVNVSRKCPR